MQVMFYPYWQISGAWARPINGKLIQSSILEFWGRFLKNSSRIEHLVEKWNWKNSGAWHRPISGKIIQIWTSFPEIDLSHAPIFYKNSIGNPKKIMDEFSRNRYNSCPGNWIFEKILNEFSRNPSVAHPEKLTYWKKFWMSFPGFANKG